MERPDGSNLSLQLAQLRVKHLALLDLIARYGSLRKVAEALHVTQPAITAMLQDIESIFGADLVKRGRQGAELTAKGIAVRQRLGVALHELQTLCTTASTSRNGSLLKVGILPVALVSLVSQVLDALKTVDPDLTLMFSEQTVEGALTGLFDGKLDCAISRADAISLRKYPPGFFCFEPLWPMTLQVACGPEHPLAQRKSIALQDLAGERWALLTVDSQIRTAFEQAFIQTGITPPVPVIESLSFLSNLHLVAQSDLITVAPAWAVQEFQTIRVVRKLPMEWPVSLSPLMLITCTQRASALGLETFRQTLLASGRRFL